MKLSKSLVITGLLFSSVLGSVNVNSIVANAANRPETRGSVEVPGYGSLPTPGDNITAKPEQKYTNVKYLNRFGHEINDKAFTVKQQNSAIISNGNIVKLNTVVLPDGYQFVTKLDVPIVNDTVTIKVEKIPKLTAPEIITPQQQHENEVSESQKPTAPEIITPNEQHEKEVEESLKPTAPQIITPDQQKPNEEILNNGKPDIGNSVELITAGTPKPEADKVNTEVTVKFVDEKNNTLKNQSTAKLDANGAVILSSISAPTGYHVISKQTLNVVNKIVMVKVQKNKVTSSKPAHFVVQQVRISFINKTTGEEVGFQQLVGKDTFSTKIDAPKHYTFVNASDATVKFDKKGNKNIKVYVKQVTPQITKHEGVVTTIDGHYKRLYNLEGQVIKSRALSANSAWYTDQFATINGETMYRVATNEWVKASDIK